MKQRALKSAILAAEVAAVVVALFAALVFALMWRLAQGPMPLTMFRASAESAIERGFPKGYDARIANIEVSRGTAKGDYVLSFSETVVADPEGAVVAAAPQVRFVFNAGDMIAGRLGPKSIDGAHARLHITRNTERRIDLPMTRQLAARDARTGLAADLEARFFRSAFREATFDNITVTFLDEASGRAWSTEDARLRLEQAEAGLTAHAAGAIDLDGERAAFNSQAIYDRSQGLIRVVMDGENFPAGDILSTFYGDGAAVLDAPVSGRARLAITPEGAVQSAEFDARIGAGVINALGAERAVRDISWRTVFDPVADRFMIETFAFDVDGAAGALSGTVSVAFADDLRKPQSIGFELRSDEIVIDAGERLPAPLPLTALAIDGVYEIPGRALRVDSFEATASGLTAAGGFAVVRPRSDAPMSPGVTADIDFTGDLDPARLLSLWPHGLADGARDWIEMRLDRAEISNLDLVVDLAPGAVRENEGVPDEALTLTFDARNVVARYVEGMTPLRNGVGRGVLRGNSFRLIVDSAALGEIPLTGGEVDFPAFMPKWQPTYYRFTAAGDAREMLSVLDEKPLQLLTKVNLAPRQFSGSARADIEIMRPNKREVLPEEYGYKGVAYFDDMRLTELTEDLEISGGKGRVDLSTRSLTVTADAFFANDAPVKVRWKQNFYRQDGPSRINVSGIFNSSAGDVFGLPTRQFLRGPVGFEAVAIGEPGAIRSLSLKADFTNSALSASAFSWRKPAAAPASGVLDLKFSGDETTLSNFSISGEGVDIRGDLAFGAGGVLTSADLQRFFLENGADLSLTARRDPNGLLAVTTIGRHLDIGGLLEQMLNESGGAGETPFPWGRGVTVNARIDRLTMRHGVEYKDGALDLRRDAERLQALDFTAFDDEERPLTVSMSLTGDGAGRMVEARTSAIGELMRGVFGYDSIHGGEGSMRLVLLEPGRSGFSGEVEARNIQVVDAPLLARIFSAGSFDGLANLLNGDGIDFSYAFGEFRFADRVLTLGKLRATGSSVGMTAHGVIGLGPDGRTDLYGAVAPLNQINSVLAAAPIIGDILTGPGGEGIVAFNYSVRGETAGPQVVVNPLTALTPGILRELVQPGRAEPAPPVTAPAATPEAPPAEGPEAPPVMTPEATQEAAPTPEDGAN